VVGEELLEGERCLVVEISVTDATRAPEVLDDGYWKLWFAPEKSFMLLRFEQLGALREGRDHRSFTVLRSSRLHQLANGLWVPLQFEKQRYRLVEGEYRLSSLSRTCIDQIEVGPGVAADELPRETSLEEAAQLPLSLPSVDKSTLDAFLSSSPPPLWYGGDE
jgi:hypothetical protein